MKKAVFWGISVVLLVTRVFSQSPTVVERMDLPSYGTAEYMDLRISYTPVADTRNWEMRLNLTHEPFQVFVPSVFVVSQTASQHTVNGRTIIISPADAELIYPSGVAIVVDVLIRSAYDHYNQSFTPIGFQPITEFSFPSVSENGGSSTSDKIWKYTSGSGVVLQDDVINENVGIGTVEAKEKFQIGSEWFFHDGERKKIARNFVWNDSIQANVRVKDGYSSVLEFGSNGGFSFAVADSNAVGTSVEPNHVFTIKPTGKVSVGGGSGSFNEDFTVFGNSYFKDKIGIGISVDSIPDEYMLAVNGGVIAKKVKVAIPGTTQWPDYVFDATYQLMPLEEVGNYVMKNKHLPGVPTAKAVAEEGYDMAEMDAKLLEKIEELTLYLIEMKKENQVLRAEIEELKNEK